MTERLDKMEKKQDSMLDELFLVIKHDEPVAVSETHMKTRMIKRIC